MAHQIKPGRGVRARALAGTWNLFLVAGLIAVAPGAAQTSLDLGNQSKNIDFSTAASTRVWKTGPVLPTTCNVGEAYFRLTAPTGLYICTSSGVWTAQAATVVSGGGLTGTFPLNSVPAVDGSNALASSGCVASAGSMACPSGFSGGTGATRITATEGAAPSVPGFSQQTLYIDATDHNLKSIDSDGAVRQYVTEISIPRIVPFAADPNGIPASGVSFAANQWAPVSREGTSNIGASLHAVPATGATLQFMLELPADWNPSRQPYIRLYYSSGLNTTGTVVWTVSSACVRLDGSATDDPASVSEPPFPAQTIGAVNRMLVQTGQFTAITAANNCLPGSPVIVNVALSGTATLEIGAYQAVVSTPELPNPGQGN